MGSDLEKSRPLTREEFARDFTHLGIVLNLGALPEAEMRVLMGTWSEVILPKIKSAAHWQAAKAKILETSKFFPRPAEVLEVLADIWNARPRIPQSEEQALAWVYSQGYELELGARGISALELWKEKNG